MHIDSTKTNEKEKKQDSNMFYMQECITINIAGFE